MKKVYFCVFLAICGANAVEDFECYKGKYDSAIQDEFPTSFDERENCRRDSDRGESCVTLIRKNTQSHIIRKECGRCDQYGTEFYDCTACTANLCNEKWPEYARSTFKCYKERKEMAVTASDSPMDGPENMQKCPYRADGKYSCVTMVQYNGGETYTVMKECGTCDAADNIGNCEQCSEDSCNEKWPKPFKCYEEHREMAVTASDSPMDGPENMHKCSYRADGKYSCVTKVQYDGSETYTVVKECGTCNQNGHSYNSDCTPCSENLCNNEWPKTIKCYAGYMNMTTAEVDSRIVEECPLNCITKFVHQEKHSEIGQTSKYNNNETIALEKVCGICRAGDKNCRSCDKDNCNEQWPKEALKCYNGIQMEGHEYNSFKEVDCSFDITNCMKEELQVDGVKFVQKRCANDCSECNDLIKGGNATGKDKERCSHYLGCWQCSGNLCNGAMPHVSFSFVILAFAILLGVRDADNMFGFVY